MSKSALASMLTKRVGLPKADAVTAVDTMLEGIQTVLLARGRVTFVGFGSFSLRERRGRRAAGENTVRIQTEVVFEAGSDLAAAVAAQRPSREVPAGRGRRKRRR